jgi:signal transduction histidine kinase
MSGVHLKSVSLLWRILLSTSIAITALFALTGWMVQTYAGRVSQHSLEEEVRTSLQAYQALWSARANNLAMISRLISSMSDVRAAFMTRDRATVRDTAQQLWSQISEQDAIFLVLDPTGKVITSLGGDYPDLAITNTYLRAAMERFPIQASGYVVHGSHLYYVVLTPVYVQAATGQALLNILLVALDIDDRLANTLKLSTHGSDFAFTAGNSVLASTLPLLSAQDFRSARDAQDGVRRLMLHGTDYLCLRTDLADIESRPLGELYIIRSFVGPGHALMELQRNVALIWLLAVTTGLALTYLLARRILEPVKRLDHAAEQVIKRNYDYRVPVETNDELGRLATTFNTMCDSIRSAREDLIRQERIATIARFATSIVHDLRSPLAAVYGGAEMLVDTQLSSEQSQRLAGNIYRASRRIQELLQDLADVTRAKAKPAEVCKVAEIVKAACDVSAPAAALQSVAVNVDIPAAIEVPVERSRVERAFLNLINNALEAMPEGGELNITAHQEDGTVLVSIEDTGNGLSEEAWATLFQPFASFGKKNGLGLGLALSRQTVVDHGGDLWADKESISGARFYLRLPTVPPPNGEADLHETTTDTSTLERA